MYDKLVPELQNDPDNVGYATKTNKQPSALVEGCLRLLFLFGKYSGSGTDTLTFYSAGGTDKRVVATLSALGNRTDITLTPPYSYS